jgi:hypothetical protein
MDDDMREFPFERMPVKKDGIFSSPMGAAGMFWPLLGQHARSMVLLKKISGMIASSKSMILPRPNCGLEGEDDGGWRWLAQAAVTREDMALAALLPRFFKEFFKKVVKKALRRGPFLRAVEISPASVFDAG